MTQRFLKKALALSAISLGMIQSGHTSSLTAGDKLMRSIVFPKSGAHCKIQSRSYEDIFGISPALVLNVDGNEVFRENYHGASTPSREEIYESRNSDSVFKELVKTAASFDVCLSDAGVAVSEVSSIISETTAQRMDDKLLYAMLNPAPNAHCKIAEGSSDDLFGASPAIVLKVDGNEVYSHTYHLGGSPGDSELYRNRYSDSVVQKITEIAKSWDVCWSDVIPAQLQTQAFAEPSQAAVSGQVEKKIAETSSTGELSIDQNSEANRAE